MTKDEWLDKALNTVGKYGVNELKIESLCKRLKLTKGSFYHHFKGQKLFINELLEYWYKKYTQEIILSIKDYKDNPLKQIEILNEVIYSKNLDIEVEFRAWGHRNKDILNYIGKIDQIRINTLIEIQNKLFPKKTQNYNKKIALYIYSQFIGSLFIQPRITKEQQKDLDNIFLELLKEKTC